MDPLEIPLILERILSFVPHPIDLRNCRLVNQLWNSTATFALNDQGATVVVSDKNYMEYFRNRAKNIAGLNMKLSLCSQPDGYSRPLLVMTKMLRQDKSETGTGSYCAKSISYHARIDRSCESEMLDETKFWALVEVAAPNLERLIVAATLDPPSGQSDKFFADIPLPPEPATQFPVLKSVIFDVRCHKRQKFIPKKLAQILNNAPGLEEYKLFSNAKVKFDAGSTAKQITFIPYEATPASIDQISGKL